MLKGANLKEGGALLTSRHCWYHNRCWCSMNTLVYLVLLTLLRVLRIFLQLRRDAVVHVECDGDSAKHTGFITVETSMIIEVLQMTLHQFDPCIFNEHISFFYYAVTCMHALNAMQTDKNICNTCALLHQPVRCGSCCIILNSILTFLRTASGWVWPRCRWAPAPSRRTF